MDINLDTIGGNLTKKLHMVVTHDKRRESAVDDMVVCLLEALGFGKGNWVVRFIPSTWSDLLEQNFPSFWESFQKFYWKILRMELNKKQNLPLSSNTHQSHMDSISLIKKRLDIIKYKLLKEQNSSKAQNLWTFKLP